MSSDGPVTEALLNLTPDGEQRLILVDSSDREVGQLSKRDAHRGEGVLHRAFSLFIFNEQDQLLLQRRSEGKPLWPGYWSNSCCSHPRHGESMDSAVHRRLAEELGLRCALKFLFKFEYQARYRDVGGEHELCSVWIGRSNVAPRVDRNEVSEVRWVDIEALQMEMDRNDAAERLTPWFRLEWARLRAQHLDEILTTGAMSSQAEGTWAFR